MEHVRVTLNHLNDTLIQILSNSESKEIARNTYTQQPLARFLCFFLWFLSSEISKGTI